MIQKYWAQIVFAIGVISAASIFPFQIKAVASDVEEVKETQKALVQTTQQIGKWIEQEEMKDELEEKYQKEQQAAAPKGFAWDRINRRYVKIRK